MIDKSESVNWSNVWWIWGADHLTFEGGLWVISEKNILQTDFEVKKLAKDITRKKNILHWRISLMTYIMLKKNLTLLYVREKISNSRHFRKKFLPKLNNQSPPHPRKAHGQPHRGGGRGGFDTFNSKCHPSTKWLAGVHHVHVFSLPRPPLFKTKVLYFKIENTPIKDTNGKRTFWGKMRAFCYEIVFREEFNLVFFTADQSALLVLNKPRQRGFWRNLRYILYTLWSRKVRF